MQSSVFVLQLTFLSSRLETLVSQPFNSNHIHFPFLPFHVLFLRKLTINDLTLPQPLACFSFPSHNSAFYLLAVDVEVSCLHSVWSYPHQYPCDLHFIHLKISPVSLTFPPLSNSWNSLLFFFVATISAMRMLLNKTSWPMQVSKIHLLLLSSSIPITIYLEIVESASVLWFHRNPWKELVTKVHWCSFSHFSDSFFPYTYSIWQSCPRAQGHLLSLPGCWQTHSCTSLSPPAHEQPVFAQHSHPGLLFLTIRFSFTRFPYWVWRNPCLVLAL